MIKKKSLGRGLDKMLSANIMKNVQPQFQQGVENSELRRLSVELIQQGTFQPRRDMNAESLQELADSIRTQGVIQPIVVRPIKLSGRYEIIAGERRWRAAQMAGLSEIPVLIKSMSDEVALAVGLIENVQREALNPIDEAVALQRLLNEFAMTHEQIATAVGKTRVAITNILRLLKLNDAVKILLERGDLDVGHAKVLLSLDGPLQSSAAEQVVSKGLSVRETELLVKRLQNKENDNLIIKKRLDPNIVSLQDRLADALGAAVVIKHHSSGNGKLMIQYGSLDELDGILMHILRTSKS